MTARPIDDIDYEREGVTVAVKSLMDRLKQLDKERDAAVLLLHREVNGFAKKGSYCLCSWRRVGQRTELIRNQKCPQHRLKE